VIFGFGHEGGVAAGFGYGDALPLAVIAAEPGFVFVPGAS